MPMTLRLRPLFRQMFPPVPADVRDAFMLLRFDRLQGQIPLLYIAILVVLVAAMLGANTRASFAVRYVIPTLVGLVCITRFFVWTRARHAAVTVPEAVRRIHSMTLVSVSICTVCSFWCVASWLAAPPGERSYYALFMAMGSLSTAYCVATIRIAAFLNLAVGLAPITLLLLASGNRADVAAGGSIAIACTFLVRMVTQQHDQLVALLSLQRGMRDLAHTDALTGLRNRRALYEQLEAAISDASADGPTFALIDLDGFKPVNDRHGHAAGDELLRAVADQLRATCGDDVPVYRLGGDEFAVLLPNASETEASTLANMLLTALVAPYPLATATVRIGASLGLARWPADGTTADELVAAADRALYVAKAQRRGDLPLPPMGRTIASA